jgi:AbrB family looped-hinge helix DNA binding protein
LVNRGDGYQASPALLIECTSSDQTYPVRRSVNADGAAELTPTIPYYNVRKKEEFTMSTATLTSKGQITIPVSVRNDLKVDAGDRVEFVQIAPGRYEFVAVTHSVTELKGMFGKPVKKVSVEDMNKAIVQRGASGR